MEYYNIFTKLRQLVVLLLGGVVASGCVGPTSPFGAVNTLGPASSNSKVKAQLLGPQKAKISFFPKRQNLHIPKNFRIEVFDPKSIPENFKLKVFYEGHDITNQFLKNAIQVFKDDGRRVEYWWPKLALIPERNNHLEFKYFKGVDSNLVAEASYKPPACQLREQKTLVHTKPFLPNESVVTYVDYISKKLGYNSNLTAGLIAQESGFDPKAVSWAKAIGLTQVTPIADKEIREKSKSWPRSPKIKRYPASVVKAMVKTGRLSKKDDWRLDPKLSIEGGLNYLGYVEDYWEKEENRKIFDQIFAGDPEFLAEVVLASYNSGSYRVKEALLKKGKSYLDDESLGEAKKYVRRVSSYCYHFGEKDIGGRHE